MPSDREHPRPDGPGAQRRAVLRELALVFLRLGATAFGGPAAHIALMRQEVVDRRQWLTQNEFVDLLGAANLIPGPNSTELAIHIGLRRAGWAGLLIAGMCFVVPAVCVSAAIAWAYGRYARVPEAVGVLDGVKPVVIAIVFHALWGLVRAALKSPTLFVLFVAAAACAFAGMDELGLLIAAGAAACGFRWARQPERDLRAVLVLGAVTAVLVAGPFLLSRYVDVPRALGPWPLFVFFAKVGSVLYGSGYVLLAFLRNDLVTRWQWLTSAQLLDAVAVGQVTPGPVFTTATFIGYILAGPPGAAAATVGIFLPAFVFVAASGPLVPRIRRSASASAFLDGVNVASLALMLVVTWQLARETVDGPLPAVLLAASAVVLIRFRVSASWLLLGGAVAGVALGS